MKDKKGLPFFLYAAVIFALLGIIVEPMRIIFAFIAWILATAGYLKAISGLASALKRFLQK